MKSLLDLADEAGLAPSLLSPKVARAMIEASGTDWDAPPMNALRRRAGDQCLALVSRQITYYDSQAASDVRSWAMLFVSNPEALPALRALTLELFAPIPGKSRNHALAVCAFLRETLLSPVPGGSELAQAGWRAARGEAADPWRDCFAGANPERYLEAICHCGRPELVGPALSGWGLDAVQAFPGARKGLDSSATMWILAKAPAPIFEAALDWFAERGALAEQACSKAWVYQGSATRKKGDLLAACVAFGKLEAAEALLARAPTLDTRPARDVAKAMGEKAQSDQGGAAVSAWEALLLRRELRSAPLPDSEPAAPAPRRARL